MEKIQQLFLNSPLCHDLTGIAKPSRANPKTRQSVMTPFTAAIYLADRNEATIDS